MYDGDTPPEYSFTRKKIKGGRETESRANFQRMGAEEEQPRLKETPVSGNGEAERTSPITEAQFLSWKRRKDADSSARKAAAARKRVEDIAAGLAQMNGRELFEHQPWVFDNAQH